MEAFTSSTIYFDQFEIDLDRRLISHAGEPLSLNPKAFNLLLALVTERGTVLSKDDLLERVWPGQFVEENNLTVHVAALRKLLGERKGEHRFIITVPGRGYKFIGELRDVDTEIVIEQHKLERIVIEEEDGLTDDADVPFARKTDPITAMAIAAPRKFAGVQLILPICLLLAVAGFGGWFLASNNAVSTAGSQSNAGNLKMATFATSGGVPHRVGISRDGRLLAYVQRYQGEDSIWIGDLETNQSIQITPASDRIHSYIGFSPDGKNIYFTARDDNHLVWTLMRVSVYGGAVQSLTTGVHSSISFSPDGSHFGFIRRDDARTGDTFLIVADAETGKNEQILHQAKKPQKITSIGTAWSPDGKSIAFGLSDPTGKHCEITILRVPNGSFNKIGGRACRENSNLAWLDDGGGIVVSGAESDELGNNQIHLVSYPAGDVGRITNDTLNYGNYSVTVSSDGRVAVLQTREDPRIWLSDNSGANARQILEGSRVRSEGMQGLNITPDGKILYAARNREGRTIWEMDQEGKNQRQVTPSQKGFGDTQIDVTADNRFLVFASDRSGESEVWRSNRDGSSLVQLTQGGGNSEPAVSPDGKWVIYTSKLDGNSRLWRVPVEGGEPTPVTTDETSWPTVSPDGKYIACAYGKAFDAADKRIAILPFDGGRPVNVFNTEKNGVLYNRLRWSPDGKAIVYKDLVQGLWRHDLDLGKPERVPVPDNYRVIHFDYSPAGVLAYSGVVQMREIVILDNYR